MKIMQNEKVSAYSHGALIPVMITGTIILVILAEKNTQLQFYLTIYGLSAITLFTASFLYHTRKKNENERSIWRKLDRSAIFVLIAGTSTPMCFLYLEKIIVWGVLSIQWILVLSGIVFSFFMNASRRTSTIVYISMGLLILLPLKTSIMVMPSNVFVLFVAGSISYITGAIIYAVKKPNPFPPNMGFHEVFHMFVIAGAVLHLLMMINGVTIYIQP